jgi:hypothetical protein
MLCHLASWGVAQNLEGLRLFTYLNSQPIQVGNAIYYPLNLDPTIGVTSVSIIFTGILAVVFLLNIRACFYLNKWVGCTGLILWLLPGLLSLLGYTPDIRSMGPDVFRFGQGFPGTVGPTAANLFICMVGGWSLVLMLSSLWKKNTFKNAYDHIWYTLGLITALYFVVDAGLPSYKEDLVEADQRMVRTLQLFRTAEKHLGILCDLPKAAALSPALCALAPELKWSVSSYLEMNGSSRAKFEPPAWVGTLATNPDFARQIEVLNNWACVNGKQSAQCQKIPLDTALSIHDSDIPIAFPSPSYAKAIQQFHVSMEKSDRRINDIEQGRNLRYFGFLFIAILAGGKLANASRAMVKADSVRPPSWIFVAIKYAGKKATASLKFFVVLSGYAYSRRHKTNR